MEVAGGKPIDNGGLMDITKRAVDSAQSSDISSAMISKEDESGDIFIRSDLNSTNAPEPIYRRAKLEELDPNTRARDDIVIQRWFQRLLKNSKLEELI